uniref:DUF2423 domain-containing protein n=1 Tax=Globisporangium ultimum (strain ATCC 200006 / CBS 805.95 / DAOM BR144) TaxID=431595 RepID=K3WEH8_GLOUD
MAKSMRSKIKRKFRTELRKKIGVPHLQVQEAKIQENLKKALESQAGGKSVFELKKLMGGGAAPVAVTDGGMDVDNASSLAKTEAELLNEEALAAKAKEKKKEAKKLANKRRKKKFVHFHTLRKKGV